MAGDGFYENYVRLGEVASTLPQKYGIILVDLVPTRRSWLDLCGVHCQRATLGLCESDCVVT